MVKRLLEGLFGSRRAGSGSVATEELYAKVSAFVPEPVTPYGAVLVQRAHREAGEAFLGGHSWIGGLPTLGEAPWPIDSAEAPMHHLATIDMAQLGMVAPDVPLPTQGQLAFFAALGQPSPRGRVIYVPLPEPVMPPDGLVDLYASAGGRMARRHPNHFELPGVLTRWPVSLHPLPRDAGHSAIQSALRSHGGVAAETTLSYRTAAGHLPFGDQPWLWDSAQRFATSLVRSDADLDRAQGAAQASVDRVMTALQAEELALRNNPGAAAEGRVATARENVERVEAALKSLAQDRAAYHVFTENVAAWAGAQAPWVQLTPEDLTVLRALFAEVAGRPSPGRFHAHYAAGIAPYRDITDLTTDTLRAVAAAEPWAFEGLPKPVQTLILDRYRQPSKHGWHQMFGTGQDTQGNNETRADQHMLMQLSHDQLVDLRLGDSGALQFWIEPQDLQAGNFDRAYATLTGT